MPDTPTERINALETKIVELQLKSLETRADDFEKRIRALETASVKVNTIIGLVLGSGLLSASNLILLLEHFSKG